MRTARENLVSAIEEHRPIVLLLGQNAWCESIEDDPVLAAALRKLNQSDRSRGGWSAMLGSQPVPIDHYDWLAERFQRRAQPASVEILSEMPWSALFTSAIDPTIVVLLSRRGREPAPILTSNETPPAARSTVRPPLYFLFSCAGERDPEAQPPKDRIELNARRIQHAVPMLNRMLDTATGLGAIVVDGIANEDDWLRHEDLLGVLTNATPGQILWFGGPPQLTEENAALFDDLVQSHRIVWDQLRLGTVIAELHATGILPESIPYDSDNVGVVTIRNGKSIEISPEERLRVEAVASIVDDSWTSFLPPLGADAKYDAFRRFHGDLGGNRLLIEGIRRGFAIERDFEDHLFSKVNDSIVDHARLDSPIIVEGQSGSGKSVALARIVAKVRELHLAPVLYAIGRIPQPEEISSFCQATEREHAQATLIVCDANRDVDYYDQLLSGLRSRGRRVVVLGSQYRSGDNSVEKPYVSIGAPATLSVTEKHKFADLLGDYFDISDYAELEDSHLLAVLYRWLPATRPRIGSGLGAEAREYERQISERGRRPRVILPISQLHQQLVEKGYISDYKSIFDDEQISTLESEGGTAGKIIDFVMVAGSVNCPVPVSLVLRAASNSSQRIDVAVVSDLFNDLDLLRWVPGDSEGNEFLLVPRLNLEAQLICSRRLGNPQAESSVLLDLIGWVRQGVDNIHERKFLLSLLQQIGRDGPRGNRYKLAYAAFGRKLTELRQRFNLVDASLMLQESAFRRSAVREGEVDDKQRFYLLEEARDAVQTAIDDIDNGRIRAARRTRQNLLVERAALFGFLANDRSQRLENPGDIWSAYQAAKIAVRRAVSASDNYYPHDVGLWTPVDLFKSAELTESQKTELVADIYSTLDQVERDALPPTQRQKFLQRRMSVGAALRDFALGDEAYDELEATGSTAGFYLRAREYAPVLDSDAVEITSSEDLNKAQHAADFLTGRLDKIQQDERCLSLLLECRWISEMRRRPLRGERQPLPTGEVRRHLLDIVRYLNRAAGESSKYGTRYLEAVLTWLTEDYISAREIFRHLDHETDNVYRRRIFKRHVVTDSSGMPISFSGRIERRLGEGRWLLRVSDMGQTISLLENDFPREDIEYGRSLLSFGIAFNFIGPIADPIRR